MKAGTMGTRPGGLGLVAFVALSLCLGACGSEEGQGDAGTPPREARVPEGSPTGPAGVAAQTGSVSPRSAPFRGGEGPTKDLPEFGAESSEAARRQAQLAVEGYLRAAAMDRWGEACAHLAPAVIAQIRQLVSGVSGAGGCGESVRAYVTAAGPTVDFRAFYADAAVESLRVDGEAGFALIRGGNDQKLWLGMGRAGGEWKVLTLVPKPL